MNTDNETAISTIQKQKTFYQPYVKQEHAVCQIEYFTFHPYVFSHVRFLNAGLFTCSISERSEHFLPLCCFSLFSSRPPPSRGGGSAEVVVLTLC